MSDFDTEADRSETHEINAEWDASIRSASIEAAFASASYCSNEKLHKIVRTAVQGYIINYKMLFSLFIACKRHMSRCIYGEYFRQQGQISLKMDTVHLNYKHSNTIRDHFLYNEQLIKKDDN